MQKRIIHQLVHTLSYGDAISCELLALQRCFQGWGWESEIYAINVHPRYKGLAKDYRDFPKEFNGEVVLHYSLGSPLNALYRSLVGATRTLIYHNLTPSHWFEGVNPRIVRDIEKGVEELPQLAAMTDRLIADSPFNARELEGKGFHVSVLELLVDPARWDLPANEGVAALLRGSPGIHVLHVGRIAPNKAVEDTIKMFFFLNQFIEKKSTLWLPGIDIDTELYSFSLKRLVYELGLEHSVRFCGPMADEELRALYENASVYVCMSEHEGFCLPVVEAMHFGLPVVAYHSSALVDTVGCGGILVKEKRPAELAELVHAVAVEGPLRERLIRAGRERVTSLSYDRFVTRAREVFESEAGAKSRAVGI